jgi:hypothetical protein
MVPLNLSAENTATDRGSIEFGLGPILSLQLYKGNMEANAFVIGSGPTRFNFGYFIANNFSIGGYAYFYSLKYEGDTESSTEFGIGPAFSLYIPMTTDRVLVNISGSFELVSWELAGDIDRSRQMAFGGSGGITYLITNNLGIFGGLGIWYSPDYKSEGVEIPDSSYTQIMAGLGFSVYI